MSNDSGAAQAGGAAVAGLVVLAAVLSLAVLTGTDPSNCQNQPAPSRQARDQIPATYLTLYQHAGQRYHIPWNVLAAIGKIETDHGRLNAPGVHSGENFAGAAGPMQFLAGTWNSFGVDGNGDGHKKRYDPADAIPAAARYLTANGAPENIPTAVFAYNHSTKYVQAVVSQGARYAQHGADVLTAEDNPTCELALDTPTTATAAKIIGYARAQLGKPYVYGAEGPDSFDCSGLTMRAYQTAGITIPRKADTQYTREPHVPRGHERPGDLVFFIGSDGSKTRPGHVGIVIGNQHMIAAPHTGTNIQIQDYSNRPDVVGFARPAK